MDIRMQRRSLYTNLRKKRIKKLIPTDMSSDVPFFLLTKKDKMAWVSEAMAKIIGWTQYELISKDLNDYIHPEDIQIVNDIIEKISNVKEDLKNVAIRYRSSNGQYKKMNFDCKFADNGKCAFATVCKK